MKVTRECPHCYSEIDARATVCPQCRRDIAPAKVPAVDDVNVLVDDKEAREVKAARAARAELLEDKKPSGLTAKRMLVLLIAVPILIGLYQELRSGAATATPTRVNCAAVAADHRNTAEDLMVQYLLAHNGGNAAMKQSVREQAARIRWPSCAAAAWMAVSDWMNAVDDDDQARMTSADERFLRAFR